MAGAVAEAYERTIRGGEGTLDTPTPNPHPGADCYLSSMRRAKLNMADAHPYTPTPPTSTIPQVPTAT